MYETLSIMGYPPYQLVQNFFYLSTLIETNIAPESLGVEDEFPLGS